MAPRELATEEIYDALLDDDALAALPARLAETLDARSVLIHWHYPGDGAEVFAHSGYFTDEQLALYASHFALIDPWSQATRSRQENGVVRDLEDFVSPAEFERSVFYNEYIRGMGDDTFRCMGLRSGSDWGTGMIAVQRGREQSRFGQREIGRLQPHARHLRRMLDLRGKLASNERRARLGDVMLDSMRDAALLVDQAGRLIHANHAGTSILDSGKGLKLLRGKIVVSDQRGDSELSQLVGRACLDGEPGTMRLEWGAWPPMILAVTAIKMPSSAPRALLLVHAMDAKQAHLGASLRSLFRLTTAESDIATLLAAGLSTAKIAQRRHASVETVRAQLRSLYQKLECHRQAEVVAIVRAVPTSSPDLDR